MFQNTPAAQIDFDKGEAVKVAAIKMLLKSIEKETTYKNDPVSATSYAPYMHGVGGLLSFPGQDPALFSTLVKPIPGLINALPVRADPLAVENADYGGADSPLYTIITGQRAGDGDDFDNQPENICDDPPVAGLLKACTQTAPYGLFSERISLDAKHVGSTTNRGETLDFMLLNGVQSQDPFIADQLRQNQGRFINNEFEQRLMTTGNSYQRLIAPLVWTGTPANNNAGGGAKQFEGFELLVNTGKVDAISGALCPAVDSVIMSFANTNVTSADANGVYIYQYMERLVRFMRILAETTGIGEVEWKWVMREDLFYRLCDVWEVQQYVHAITMMDTINTAAAGGRVQMDARAYNEYRFKMRDGKFLPVDGKIMEVIPDNTIPETIGGGLFRTDIYLIPFTVMGNIPVCYWQFWNFDNGQLRQLIPITADQIRVTDGGRVFWAFNQKNGCFDWNFWTRPRILLHTPFLAARIEDVGYDPGLHSRSWDPNDGDGLWYNGGRTNIGVPNAEFNPFYVDWSPSTGVVVGDAG